MPRYWWVNQNQTYRQELAGGYLWSPKTKDGGARNHYYETMKEVSPGDIIFSYRDTRIAAIGIAKSNAYECPKPDEFERIGPQWGHAGWKVDVSYLQLENQIRPKEHFDRLKQLLPRQYSPLRDIGVGKQNMYLTEIGEPMARMLASIIGREAALVTAGEVRELPASVDERSLNKEEWENRLQERIVADLSLSDTQRKALILARRGQGLFRRRVLSIESQCRVTKVHNQQHLIGSHIKPWRDCESADERLDGENGLLLTPSIDHLFDGGFISFEDNGNLLISPIADRNSLKKMGIVTDSPFNGGSFSSGQKSYLEFHRDEVFLRARL